LRRVFLIALAFVLAGCLQGMLWRHEDVFAQATPNSQLNTVSGTDECYDTGPCLCMFCTNRTSGWIFKETSLVGGNCTFVSCTNNPNDPLYINNTLSAENTFLKTFFIGQGATYAEFEEANRYARSALPLAVKWLIRTDGKPPFIPSRKMAECYLSYDVIPAYLVYTKGALTGPSAIQFASDLAQNLNGLGPVIVAPEVRFDAKNSTQVSDVLAQASAIKANCPNCLVALVPRDEQAFDGMAFGKEVNDTIRQAGSSIDLIGRGLLVNELKQDAREPKCDAEEALIEDIVPFAREAMKNFHKPTIILFYGGSEGGECGLNITQIADFHDYIMHNIPMLTSAGIIGISLFQLQDRASPVATVSDAGWGVVSLSQNEEQKTPSFNVWFNRTRTYFGEDERLGSPEVPLVFSYNGKQGGACDFMAKLQMSALQPPDYSSSAYTQPMPQTGTDFECESENPNLIGSFRGIFTDDFMPVPGTCSWKLAVKVMAETCELDPKFYRSLLIAEANGPILSPGQFSGKEVAACEAWNGMRECAEIAGITDLDTIAFFAALAYKRQDNSVACGHLMAWNASYAADPDYAAWIYVCADSPVCVKYEDVYDEEGNYIGQTCTKQLSNIVSEPFPCIVAATYNSLSC